MNNEQDRTIKVGGERFGETTGSLLRSLVSFAKEGTLAGVWRDDSKEELEERTTGPEVQLCSGAN